MGQVMFPAGAAEEAWAPAEVQLEDIVRNRKWLSYSYNQGQDHLKDPKSILISSERSRPCAVDSRSWIPN